MPLLNDIIADRENIETEYAEFVLLFLRKNKDLCGRLCIFHFYIHYWILLKNKKMCFVNFIYYDHMEIKYYKQKFNQRIVR